MDLLIGNVFNYIADRTVKYGAKFVERFCINRQIVSQTVYRATADTIAVNQIIRCCVAFL